MVRISAARQQRGEFIFILLLLSSSSITRFCDGISSSDATMMLSEYSNCTSRGLGYYYYYDENATTTTQCLQCSAGSYCPRRSSGSILPPNVYDPPPIACPAGTASPAGSYDLSQCLKCPVGTFSPRIAHPCEPCPVGTYSATVGTYMNCTVCPAGYECPNKASAPVKCSDLGFYSGFGATSCTQCSAGTYSDTAGKPASCTPCWPGRYSPGINLIFCSFVRFFHSSNRFDLTIEQGQVTGTA